MVPLSAVGESRKQAQSSQAHQAGSPLQATHDVPPLGSPASHRIDVRLHGLLSLLMGVFAVGASPLTEHPSGVAGLGILVALSALPALCADPSRFSPLHLRVGHMLAVVGVVVAAALSGSAADLTAGPVTLVIVVLHSACFRTSRETWFHIGWSLTCFGVMLSVFSSFDASRAIGAWCVLALTLVVIGVPVTWLRIRVDLLVAELRFLAEHDPLTGLLNRRGFRARAASLPLGPGGRVAMLMVDVDHFKRLNDVYGHEEGDAALAWLGSQLREFSISTAIAGRHGGEEFVVLFPVAEPSQAGRVAEQLRRQIADEGSHRTSPLTVSIGVATGTVLDLSQLFTRADSALYRAKSAGRNRVEIEANAATVP